MNPEIIVLLRERRYINSPSRVCTRRKGDYEITECNYASFVEIGGCNRNGNLVWF